MPFTTTDWLIILVMLVVFALIVGLVNARRLARIERKLDAVLNHLGVGYVEGVSLPTSSPGTLQSGELAPRDRLASAYGDQSESLDGAASEKPGVDSEEVVSLLRAGNKIGAIKLYRERHAGMGLREAKEAVDAIQARGAIR